MAKEKQDNGWFFSSSQEVEDGNGESPKSNKENSSIPLLDEDDEITDDDLDSAANGIPLADEDEDEPKKKDKSTSKLKTKPKKGEEDDEEEEEDELEEEEETEENEEEDEDEPSSINLVAVDLIQKGILTPKDNGEYEDSDIGLAKLVEDTVEARIKEKLPEDYSSLLDAIEQGIPASEWLASITPDEDLKNVDLDDEENQEVLVYRASKLAGLDDSQIEKKIKRLKATDGLKDEAEEAHVVLVKKDEKDKAAANLKVIKDREESIKKQNDYIDSLRKKALDTKEIDGDYLNKKEQKELADYMTKPVTANGETQYMLDRNDPEIIVKAAYLVKNARNNKTQKLANSRATSNLKKELDKKTDLMTSGKGKAVKEARSSSRMAQGQIWDVDRRVED